MPSGLGEILDRTRELYVAQFTEAVKQLAKRPGVNVLSEVVLRNEKGEPVGEGVLGLPLRLDLAVLPEDGEAEPLSVDSEKLLSFEPISFDWSELQVTLGPFHWDSVPIRIPRPARGTEWEPLVFWFREWFREDEDGTGELLGVIHLPLGSGASGQVGSVQHRPRFSTGRGVRGIVGRGRGIGRHKGSNRP